MESETVIEDSETETVIKDSESETVIEDSGILKSEADTDLDITKDKCNSYSRETKLAAIQYYHKCKNNYKTAKKFSIKSPMHHGWLQNETKIQKSSRVSRKVGCGRGAFWPDMGDELHQQFCELHEKGLKVKNWWFKAKSKELMREIHPDVVFKFSNGWFAAFKLRKKISYHSTTNISQKTPSHFELQIRRFHRHIRQLAKQGVSSGEIGQYKPCDIGNIDQTPLLFTSNKGRGYDDNGTRTVWHHGRASGLEKRQCTVQLTVFADGKPRLKPILIFQRGRV